jgi:hypothetical protein
LIVSDNKRSDGLINKQSLKLNRKYLAYIFAFILLSSPASIVRANEGDHAARKATERDKSAKRITNWWTKEKSSGMRDAKTTLNFGRVAGNFGKMKPTIDVNSGRIAVDSSRIGKIFTRNERISKIKEGRTGKTGVG